MNLFIIGAGFTKAIFSDAPLNRDLLRQLAAANQTSVSLALGDRYKTDDIEMALTKLDVDLANTQEEQLLKIRKSIESELASYFRSFCGSEELIAKSSWLPSLLDEAFQPGDVAISLNYDCVLEGLLDCCRKWSPNGGYGSSLNNQLATDTTKTKSPVTVLKIHGSANFVIAPYANWPKASCVSFDFEKCFFPISAKNSHFRFGAGTGRSFLIAPSYVKVPTVEIAHLMLEALSASTKAKNLIIIGSALRPEDSFLTVVVTNFLSQPDWQSRRIILIDPKAEQIRSKLRHYWGVNIDAQIFSISGLLESSIPQLLGTIGKRNNGDLR